MNKLKFFRKAAGLSQRDLGAKVGLSQNSICWLETEKSRPTLKNAYKLSEALSVPLNELFPDGFQDKGPDRIVYEFLVDYWMIETSFFVPVSSETFYSKLRIVKEEASNNDSTVLLTLKDEFVSPGGIHYRITRFELQQLRDTGVGFSQTVCRITEYLD